MTKATAVHLASRLKSAVNPRFTIRVVYEDYLPDPDIIMEEIETERGVKYTQEVGSRMLEAAADATVIDQAPEIP